MCVFVRVCVCVTAREDADAGSSSDEDLCGGSLQNLPSQVAANVASCVGDLTSLVQLQQTCRWAEELVSDPNTWTNKHVGIIASAAIGEGWLRKESRLMLAMYTSRVMALQWPLVQRTMLLAETVTTVWRSKLPVHSPVYLELDAADGVQRCTFTVGTPDARCWCELVQPHEDEFGVQLGHSHLHRPSPTVRTYIPARRPARLIQVEWWSGTLIIFVDGHDVGSLPLRQCVMPQWSPLSLYTFRDSNSPRMPGQTSTCFLPTELATDMVLTGSDLAGGTHAADLLQVLPCVASWLTCLPDVLPLGTCSSAYREAILDRNFWLGSHIQVLAPLSLAFRQSTFFSALREVWAGSVASLSCPHELLHVFSSLDSKLWLQGRGEHMNGVYGMQQARPTAIFYWRSQTQTCQTVRLECSMPRGARFFVLALRKAEHRSSPENSTCMVFKRPFTTEGEVQFRLADGERTRMPAERWMQMETTSRHIFELQWHSQQLRLVIDNTHIIGLSLGESQWLDPWSRTAAMCVTEAHARQEDFQTEILPFQYHARYHEPACAFCGRASVGCCRQCQHWFCGRHGSAAADACLGCVSDTFLVDRLGGASEQTPAQAASVRQGATRVIEERRLQALRRLYMRFTGDVSRLAVLCQRIAETEDILHAFSAPPSRPALDCTSLDERIRRRLGEAITSCEGAVFFQLMRHVDPIPGAGCLADFGLDACLPRSLRDQSWPRSVAVAIPSSFDVEHLSGIQVLDLLAVCNPHDRDAYLSFEPREHVYAWQGRRIGLSVTGLVHSLVQTFEPRDALLAMRNGRNWPRPEYVIPNMASELRRLMPANDATLGRVRCLLVATPVDVPAICHALQELAWTHPGHAHWISLVSMTDAEILSNWNKNRRTAAAEGTWVHALCECLLNKGTVPLGSPEICMFFKFLQRFQAEGWTLYRTEWAVYAEAEDLAGSIDAVACRGNEYCILDWKRTKQLSSKDVSYGRTMRYPLADLPDTVLWHYRVQLNIYAWILQTYYGLHVTDLRVVCLHPDNAMEPFVLQVQTFSDKIERLMSWRRQDQSSRLHLTSLAEHDARAGGQADLMVQWICDIRGGSQEGGESFSQMVEQQLAEELEPEEPVPKRQKASGSTDFVDMSATMTQYMQTDFDMDSIPSRLHDMDTSSGMILQEVANFQRVVADYEASAEWSTSFRFLVQGALAIHRLRLLDISRREEVMFLELIEGSGRHVRARDGQCFFYSEHGHWNVYKGVVPEGTLARCKKFLLQLEGLYALFGPNVLRDHDGILTAAQGLLERHSNSPDILFAACEEAAICRLPVRNKASSHGEEDDPEQRGNGSMHWTLAMANTIGKLYVKLSLSCSDRHRIMPLQHTVD